VGAFHRVSEVCPSRVAPHLLRLKVGAFHRVTKESESQNGAITVVITGNNRRERVSTTRTNLEPSESCLLPFTVEHRKTSVDCGLRNDRDNHLIVFAFVLSSLLLDMKKKYGKG